MGTGNSSGAPSGVQAGPTGIPSLPLGQVIWGANGSTGGGGGGPPPEAGNRESLGIAWLLQPNLHCPQEGRGLETHHQSQEIEFIPLGPPLQDGEHLKDIYHLA